MKKKIVLEVRKNGGSRQMNFVCAEERERERNREERGGGDEGRAFGINRNNISHLYHPRANIFLANFT